jgi:3-phosphoshikimate 1-carboxyvinyltransferase
MKAIIEPGKINGVVMAPPSKSMTQRVYAAALLHRGNTTIHNAGYSDDENAALQIIRQLGAKIISEKGHTMHIASNGLTPVSASVVCEESGLAARLFTPIAGTCDCPLLIEGKGSLLRRPMHEFGEVLPALNVSLGQFNGYLPFTVQGPMTARPVKINAAESSQFLSGLLFAFCSCAKEPVAIEVQDLVSRPYIDMTLEVLAHFGKPVTHDHYKVFYIDPSLFTYKEDVEISIEGDWSSASFLLVGGAIAGDITVQHLNSESKQADRAIIDGLGQAGAEVIITGTDITVKKAHLHAFEFDAVHSPDLFPALAILASCCVGESAIRGVHRLFHKESNRVESITEMLQNFAVSFSVEDDTLYVTGVPRLQGTLIDSYHDHRIVMAAAIGALRANGPVDIFDVASVDKSYPDFFKDLILCGGRVVHVPQLNS